MEFEQVLSHLNIGFIYTVVLFAVTLVGALPLGLIISLGSMSKFRPLKYLIKTFVWIIRGTPLVVQILAVFYGPSLLTGTVNFWTTYFGRDDGRFIATSVTFIINYACYFSEIYRGGIESISKGQYEAGQVLGMTKSQVFFKVVLMQVVKRVTPPMSNEVITLVKDTSLARIIGIMEITFMAEEYLVKGVIWPIFFTALYYLAFTGILTLLFGYIEKKLDYYRS